MKRFLSLVFATIILSGGIFLIISTHASSDCKEVEFSNETVCVDIDRVSGNTFKLITDKIDGSTNTLRCDIMMPDSGLRSIPACNGNFTFDRTKYGRIKLWIRANEEAPIDREDKPNSSSLWTYPQWRFDFRNERWLASDNYINDDDNDYDTDNFSITASPSDPDEDEYVDITVRARDGSSTDTSYRGTVRFSVERKSGSSWVAASSSYYTLARTSYSFSSSDNGQKTFSNLVRFRNDSYDYRLVVYDDDDDSIIGYKTFYLYGDDDDDDNDTDNFYVTASPSDPDEDEYVNITVRARDGSSTDTSYRGTVRFSVERKSGSSWVTASSSYYTLARTSYTFTSSDDGEYEFSNLVRFRNDSYDYRLVVYDDDDDSIIGYKTFYLYGDDDDDDDNDTDNFYVTASPSDPDEDEYVDITVRARDGSSTDTSYRGTVRFSVERKSGSSWVAASSSYYTLARTSYSFSSSDNGQKTFSNLVRFRNDSYDYRLVVYDDDDDDIIGYKTFYLYGDDDDDAIDGFSSSELATVQSIYSSWPTMISSLKSQYSKLRNHTTWNNRSDTFYSDMKDILDDESNRTYDTYSEFYAGFSSRYSYTISIR